MTMKQHWKKILLTMGIALTGMNIGLMQVAASGEPVETEAPNTEYEPSFPEQTRGPGIETETEYDVNIVAEGLQFPWGMTQLPDGRLAITQKGGTLVLVSIEDGSVSEPIIDFPEVSNQGQGGLLDVVAAPDFEESRVLYFTFSDFHEEGTVTAVGRGRLSDDETIMEDFEVIFRAEPAYQGGNHYGSRLVFNKEGNIFVSTGERSDQAIREQAQAMDSYLGKIIQITPDGEPIVSDSFSEDAWPGIYSYGHRNVQGMDIHPETGEIWIAEMGPQGGDELNLIEEGSNYGWPVVSYGVEYSGAPINEGETSAEDFTEPVYYWDPVLAPSGMAFYDSDVISEWQNNLFIGGLRGSHIARIVLEDNRVVGEERLLADEGERFRDVLAGDDGALYAITDGGYLYQIIIAE